MLNPNLNAALVKGAELAKREASKAASAHVKERDKAALIKQRSDAVKSAEEKKRKAQKVERRG